MRSLLMMTALISAASGQDKKPDPKKPERIAINDPAKLKDNKAFEIQGEYQGSFLDKTNAIGAHFGLNLISRGFDRFEAAVHEKGLPGLSDKSKRVSDKPKFYQLKDNQLTSEDGKETVKIQGKQLVPSADDVEFKISRVERKSPTLGAEPPKGAIVLFNKPEDLNKWEKMNTVKLSDGEFLGVGGRTKQKFQSFTLHLEFRLPWMPNSTGQQRGNSGVYIQDRYEIQVLDSFGLEGKDNECGGIYKESKPKVNMCFPPMVWQTYDIDFTAATFENGKKVKPAVITVKHNGVVIHDKLELKNNTPGGGITKEVPEPGSLYLQNHGDPVVYRNIWIVEK